MQSIYLMQLDQILNYLKNSTYRIQLTLVMSKVLGIICCSWGCVDGSQKWWVVCIPRSL